MRLATTCKMMSNLGDMPTVPRNWKKRLSPKSLGLLGGLKQGLRAAWVRDEKGSVGFPFKTANLTDKTRSRLLGKRQGKLRKLPTPRIPRKLEDLLEPI